MFKSNNKFQIKTPNGWEDFRGVKKIERGESVTVFSSDGKRSYKLSGSPDHKIKTEDDWVELQWIEKGTKVETNFGWCEVTEVTHERKPVKLYDVIDSGVDHCYYTNNILSHNCQFIGSSSTLISPTKLGSLSYINPIRKKEEVDFYEEPKVGHNYFITVDCARGLRMDYSAFVVMDVTNAPYKVVAKYRSNSVTPLIFPRFIYNIANYFNNAHVLVEANDVGQQVVESLALELGYENVLRTKSMGRAGWVLSGDGGGAKLGVTTSQSVKTKGCSNLKSLIETDRLIVEDYDIFVELTTFTRKSDSMGSAFAAEPGTNDDLVMCMVLFSWAVMSDYWKELTNIDVAKAVYEEAADAAEEEDDGLPLGFARINTYETIQDNSGDVWTVVDIDEDHWTNNPMYRDEW